MDQEEDLLDSLLAVANDQLDELLENAQDSVATIVVAPKQDSSNTNKTQQKVLIDTDVFQFESNLTNTTPKTLKTNSLIHTGDTDSSDDEGNRNYEDQKYNECGRQIKRLLNDNDIPGSHYGAPKKRVSNWATNPNKAPTVKSNQNNPTVNKSSSSEQSEHKKVQDVFFDPIFCMRIINPKISSSMLMEKMQGRLAVRFSDLQRQIFAGNLKDKDWVICGVLVSKSPPKTSQKGSEYSIWTLTDLKDDIKTIALFMFSSAHKDLWKTAVGTVIGVLNPSIMDRRDGSKDEACLSVDTVQRIMVFGQSKDFGICKSIKKNGEKCMAIVNLSQCEFCIYHIKQEYQKCSKRSELQANFAGKGLVNLRNKVLGKNEVFYAGKSYTAIPSKKSKKLEARDNNILRNLDGTNKVAKAKKVVDKKKKGMARHLDVNPAQRARDLELLKKLGGPSLESKTNFSGVRSNEISFEDSKATAVNVISKLKAKNDSSSTKTNIKKSQYDLKGDLFVNVDSKSTFTGKASETVSLEDSKNTALSVISKLNANKTECSGSNSQNEENYEELSLEEFEAELNYSDDEEIIKSDCPPNTLSPPNNLKGNKSGEKRGSSLQKNTPKQTKDNVVRKFESQEISPHEKHKTPVTPKQIKCKNTGDKVARKPLFNSSRSFDSPNKTNSTLSPAISKISLNNGLGVMEKTTPKNSLHKDTNSLDKMTMGIPMLSGFGKVGVIDLGKPITSRHVDRAKLNALKYIQRTGPIKRVDPNNTKGSGAKKRNIENLLDSSSNTLDDDENSAKKSKLQESEFISDRFKKMMAMTSKHLDLLEHHDDQEKEKYFNKLEVKEKMEDKMANTHKVKCKAVKCLQCKYTSFSASDFCKSQRHTLKVFDAMKRFYKCSNCQNRTVTLELIPTKPCNNCGSSKWEKTGMMKEKIAVVQHNLSIRGGEQKFVNSVAADANLDLLVPDEL